MTTLPPELRARLLRTAAAEPAPADGYLRRGAIAATVSAIWILVIFSAVGPRPDWMELPGMYAWGTVGMLVVAAMALSYISLARGRAMLGPRVELLLGAVAMAPLVVFAWTTLVRGAGPSTVTFAVIADSLRRALVCDAISILLATPLLAALLWQRRDLFTSSPVLTGSCLGAGVAAFAHAAVHAHCPIGNLSHALVDHALPLVPLMIAGAVLARRQQR
jgi:hypothetical protein